MARQTHTSVIQAGVDRSESAALDVGQGQPQSDLSQCCVCSRGFTDDRIRVHQEICAKAKPRPVYDVAAMRIAGTGAEDLVKAGKLVVDPAKPLEKKSVLSKKVISKVVPAVDNDTTKRSVPATAKPEEGKGVSYQVVFDSNDKLKTKKNSKILGFQVKAKNTDAMRFLSPDGDRKVVKAATGKHGRGATKANQDRTYQDEDEDEGFDYLAASMASQRTVCSDAFDFLFDSHNLDPEFLKQKLEQDGSVCEGDAGHGCSALGPSSKGGQQSGCCTVA